MGLFHCELHLAPRNSERLYGMGENATGRLNLKGSVIDLYQRHVKAVVPFVVSSEGYPVVNGCLLVPYDYRSFN